MSSRLFLSDPPQRRGKNYGPLGHSLFRGLSRLHEAHPAGCGEDSPVKHVIETVMTAHYLEPVP